MSYGEDYKNSPSLLNSKTPSSESNQEKLLEIENSGYREAEV